MPAKSQADSSAHERARSAWYGSGRFLPLYLTHFHAAIQDGGLLLIGSVFAADGIMRCLDPSKKATNWSVFFGVGSLVFLGLTISEYAPLAERQLQQDEAVAAWVQTGNPNDSILLLAFRLVLDVAVIFVVDKGNGIFRPGNMRFANR